MTIKTVTPELLSGSVLSVPPLARNADYSLSKDGNRRILAHLAAGGVTTALYGGNANLYNMGVREFDALLDQLEEVAPAGTWIIPSVGPDYGKAEDQLHLLKSRALPTAMVLPMTFPATPAGVATGIRRLSDQYGKPLIAYIKSESHISASDLARLVADGAICAIKYAVARDDTAVDAYLDELLARVDRGQIVSGMGERPAAVHMSHQGLSSFTSGSVCIAPGLSQAMLNALKAGDLDTANRIRETFIPLEDLRDTHSQLRVLHAAVATAGVAETGPLQPFLSLIEDAAILSQITEVSRTLLAKEEAHRAKRAAA